MVALPADFELSRTREEHRADHRLLHRAANVRPPAAGVDASGAINDALARQRAVLAPGDYRLASTLALGTDALLDSGGANLYPDEGVTAVTFSGTNAIWTGGIVRGGGKAALIAGSNHRLANVLMRGQSATAVHCHGAYGAVIEQIVIDRREISPGIYVAPQTGILLDGPAGDNTTTIRDCWVNQCGTGVVVDGTATGDGTGPQVAITLSALTFHSQQGHAIHVRGRVWNLEIVRPYFEANGVDGGGPWANVYFESVAESKVIGARIINGYHNNLEGRWCFLSDAGAVSGLVVELNRRNRGDWQIGNVALDVGDGLVSIRYAAPALVTP